MFEICAHRFINLPILNLPSGFRLQALRAPICGQGGIDNGNDNKKFFIENLMCSVSGMGP